MPLVALLRLLVDAAAAEGVSAVPELPAAQGFTSADVGVTNLNFAGFGVTETGSSGTKLQVDLTLGGLGCSVSGCPDSGDSATQISYSQPLVDGGPCSGDSGGPAFIDRSGTTYMAGLTSYGDANCRIYGVSTRADAFEAEILAFAGPVSDTGGGDTGDSVAKPLFGLCNSDCEAMDCDSEAAHANGCDSVLENYLDKSGGAFPPCANTDEPEIDISELAIEQLNSIQVPGVQ